MGETKVSSTIVMGPKLMKLNDEIIESKTKNPSLRTILFNNYIMEVLNGIRNTDHSTLKVCYGNYTIGFKVINIQS